MAQLNPYLVFKGNCREAMNFYKDCFGGKLDIQTVGESAHLSLDCDSEKEANTLFTKLGEGGKVTQPLAAMPWGALHGQLVDKFGKSWFFNFSKS